jgi:blue copper oxidase
MTQLSRRTALLGGAAASILGTFRVKQADAQQGVRQSLPIPPELRANVDGLIALDARPGSMRFQGNQDTATYGINGPYLGPAGACGAVRRWSRKSPTASRKTPPCIGMD